MENPFHSRYKMIKVLEDSSLRCKMLIHRRKTLHRYVMIAVPTVTDRSGKSNGCKDFVAKLLKLSHPNIARVIEAFLHKDYCYYVFEDWYTTRKLRGLGFHTLSEPEIATTIRHVCSAIRYLHVNGIVVSPPYPMVVCLNHMLLLPRHPLTNPMV